MLYLGKPLLKAAVGIVGVRACAVARRAVPLCLVPVVQPPHPTSMQTRLWHSGQVAGATTRPLQLDHKCARSDAGWQMT